MEQRVEQYKEQLELQRQTYSSQRDETSDFRDILRKKDKEMNAVLDQVEVCTTFRCVYIHFVELLYAATI